MFEFKTVGPIGGEIANSWQIKGTEGATTLMNLVRFDVVGRDRNKTLRIVKVGLFQ